MNVSCFIFHDTKIQLWNLPSHVRYQRMLGRMGISQFFDDIRELPSHHSILIIRGDYLYDERVFSFLLQQKNVLLNMKVGGHFLPVAAHVDSALASSTLDGMKKKSPVNLPNLRSVDLAELTNFFSNELRKFGHPSAFPIRQDNQSALEDHLFRGSYKGVTDCITKFLWPELAKRATRFCAKRGITPNQVTTASLVLVMIVTGLFGYGYFALGLALGWVMTFLDTVDGKLARVTVTSSRWGNIFDHGIDLIHPPLWYLAWGIGLTNFIPFFIPGLTLEVTIGLIFVGYIIGRIIEGVFQWILGGFVIFCWRPFDSFFRLVAARRNPNLIFLTASVLFDRPDVGLEVVALWTVACTVVLFGRLLWAVWVKATGGTLRSWLAEIEPAHSRDALAVRLFINPPATID